jgi:hypothetical protein
MQRLATIKPKQNLLQEGGRLLQAVAPGQVQKTRICGSDNIWSSLSTCGFVHPLRGQPVAFEARPRFGFVLQRLSVWARVFAFICVPPKEAARARHAGSRQKE